ncbi:MAG TPA: endonuclease/exonuclease/phosphatase family protein [Pelobium sp.]|nr:endonuclease/exonuclease/phosphatase family protein [Pelobium sp.]
MKKKGNSFLNKALLFVNFIAIVALLLSYCATVVDPLSLWYFTMFGLAYPFILLANVLFLILWLVLRKWYFLYSLAFILIGYQPLTRTFGFRFASESDAVADSSTLKMMTYNVHNFRNKNGELDTASTEGFLRLIADESPDVVGFQEFFSRHKGKYDFKDSLFKQSNFKSHYFNKTDSNDYEYTGVAVFSKYPIMARGEIKFETKDAGNKGIWVDIKKNEKVIRVYVVHLASISFQPEDYSFINEVKTDINNSKDVTSSKRIVRKLKIAFEKRSKEVKMLKTHMASCTTPYIIMGDFNDTPASFTLAQMTEGLKNAFQEKGAGLGKTYNGDFPNFQIDYILASPAFHVKTYRIIKQAYSDHYPVRANLSLE